MSLSIANLLKPLDPSSFLSRARTQLSSVNLIVIEMAAMQRAIERGAVPGHVSNVCPVGTKAWLLEVGWLECDEAFVSFWHRSLVAARRWTDC